MQTVEWLPAAAGWGTATSVTVKKKKKKSKKNLYTNFETLNNLAACCWVGNSNKLYNVKFTIYNFVLK